MSYCIGTVLEIFAFLKKKNKVILGLLFIYAFVLFAFNTKNPDLVNYENQFIGHFFGFSEPLYILLAAIFRRIGLNFYIYRGFLALLGLALITKTINDYSPYPTACFAMVLLYPYIMDVVQIRFFIGYSVIVYALRYIIRYHNTKSLKYIVLFFCAILIGMGFHYSIVFYSILFVLFLDMDKHHTLIYIIVPILLALFLMNLPVISKIATLFLGDWKITRWILGTKDGTINNFIRILITRASIVFSLFFFDSIIKEEYDEDQARVLKRKNNTIGDSPETSEGVTNRIFLLAFFYTELFVLFEIVIASEYERLTRPALIWGGILITRILEKMEHNNRKLCWGIWLMIIVFYFLSQMIFPRNKLGETYLESVFNVIMNHNMLLH